MSLKIGDHLFTGPFQVDKTRVRANHPPAVYAIICKGGQPWDPTFRLLDVGETGENGIVFAEHERLAQWEADNDGELCVYLLQRESNDRFDLEARESLVEDLRTRYDPPQGMVQLHAFT